MTTTIPTTTTDPVFLLLIFLLAREFIQVELETHLSSLNESSVPDMDFPLFTEVNEAELVTY